MSVLVTSPREYWSFWICLAFETYFYVQETLYYFTCLDGKPNIPLITNKIANYIYGGYKILIGSLNIHSNGFIVFYFRSWENEIFPTLSCN